MNRTALLTNPQQALEAMRALWEACRPYLMSGGRLVVTVSEEPQTRSQQNLYHDLIDEIAAQAKHLGATWDAEDWKRLLINKWAKETGRKQGRIIPALDGDGVVEVGLLSRKFSKHDANEFIDWLYAWCAENGVDLAVEPA